MEVLEEWTLGVWTHRLVVSEDGSISMWWKGHEWIPVLNPEAQSDWLPHFAPTKSPRRKSASPRPPRTR